MSPLRKFPTLSSPLTSTAAFNRLQTKAFQRSLKLFHRAAQTVPAYADFLVKHKIKPEKIRTLADWQQIPPMTKDNYLRQYPLKDLLWGGGMDAARVISMSSGSSGQPFYWPRGNGSTVEAAAYHEELFQHFQTKEKDTLVVVAFAMGTWIAGTYTLSALSLLADQGHRLTIITPGIDKAAITRILRELAPQFEQTILMGYPPFIKDAIDAAVSERIKLGPLNLRVVVAGESISERWRDYLLGKIKADDPCHSCFAIYGTADCGLLGHETPFSIYARRTAEANHELADGLFPQAITLPTLVQYDPLRRFFEEVDDYLLFTADNSLPLIRYKILDQGRLFAPAQLSQALQNRGLAVPTDLLDKPALPYLALYSRSDVATTFYALDIYPENIKMGLESTALQRYLTGKFILKTIYDDETQEQSLHLFVELKKRIRATDRLKQLVTRSVVKSLQRHNSEFNRLSQELKHKSDPIVNLLANESPEFTIKIKHRWIAQS